MGSDSTDARPTVTVVFLAHNRRDDLRLSLEKMLGQTDYDKSLLDVVVVDNASTDETAAMVRTDFPAVQLVERTVNSGVSGFNDGFALARGDYVLALDDDCYLPGDGLRRAVEEAERERADLVSFGVISAQDEQHRFDRDQYRTGMFTFWGCAVLMRREVLEALEGYDPNIFVWANEVEFLMRFYDRGFRHLYLPEVIAVHAKEPTDWLFRERVYRLNSRHYAYVAGKLLLRRDSAAVLLALAAHRLRDAARYDRRAVKGLVDTLAGYVRGLRARQAVRPEVSTAYRRHYAEFSNPLRMSRSVGRLLLNAAVPSSRGEGDVGRRDQWRSQRPSSYPEGRAVLEL